MLHPWTHNWCAILFRFCSPLQYVSTNGRGNCLIGSSAALLQSKEKSGGFAPSPRRSTAVSKKVLGILALVLTAVVIMACGEANTTPPATVTGTVTSAPQAKHFKVGDQVKVDSWIITINSATTSAGDEFDQPKNGQYLILDITFKNTDSASHTVSSIIQFQFQDSTGQKYDDQITGLSGVTAPDGDVQAGSQARGQVVYDVPTSEHAFTFTFTPDLGDSTAAVWDISI